MNHIFKTQVQSTAIATGLLTVGVAAAEGSANIGAATFNTQGELVLPEGFREWVFIGAPLTPHGLNNGKAGFPEYHHVYVNPDAFAVYQRTGEFPDGTVIAKELVLLQKGDFKDGSKNAPSGRGFFAGEFQGMDVMVKDSARYKDTDDLEAFAEALMSDALMEAMQNEAFVEALRSEAFTEALSNRAMLDLFQDEAFVSAMGSAGTMLKTPSTRPRNSRPRVQRRE